MEGKISSSIIVNCRQQAAWLYGRRLAVTRKFNCQPAPLKIRNFIRATAPSRGTLCAMLRRAGMKQNSYVSIMLNGISNKKGSLMGLICLSLVINCPSCKKKTDESLNNTNEVRATIIRAAGNTTLFNSTGSKVRMGATYYGVAEEINAKNGTNDDLVLTIAGHIQVAGTYDYLCQYYQSSIPAQPVYKNSGGNPGSVTFTSYSDNYWEGYFFAVCRAPNGDSVIVAGTFKGNHIQL